MNWEARELMEEAWLVGIALPVCRERFAGSSRPRAVLPPAPASHRLPRCICRLWHTLSLVPAAPVWLLLVACRCGCDLRSVVVVAGRGECAGGRRWGVGKVRATEGKVRAREGKVRAREP